MFVILHEHLPLIALLAQRRRKVARRICARRRHCAQLRTVCNYAFEMLVLALDTSTHVASIALVRDGIVLAERESQVRAQHGESLLPMMESCFAEASVTLSDIGLIAVGTGPGSFTGLRIALATVKGLWLAKRIPVVGVSSLRALASGVAEKGARVVTLFDAFKGEVFAAVYERTTQGLLHESLEPICATPANASAEIARVLGSSTAFWVGDGTRKFHDAFVDAIGPSFVSVDVSLDSPRARYVAIEGLARFSTHGADDAGALEPVYVRPVEATFSLPAKS